MKKFMAILLSICLLAAVPALAADYFCIYYVDLATDYFIEYSAQADYRKLGLEPEGSDFFGVSHKNILRVVHPQDQKRLLTVFTKERLLEEMAATGAFTVTYRLMFGEHPTYVHLKAIHMVDGNSHHIVIGINNINAQVKREEELGAARERAYRDALTGVKSKYAFEEGPFYEVADRRVVVENEKSQNNIKVWSDIDTDAVQYMSMPTLSFNQEESEIIANVAADVATVVEAQMLKWMTGAEPLDDASWESYLGYLRDIGAEDYLSAYETAYARYLSR